MATRIQVRRGTSSEWNSADPVLFEGEIGYNVTLGQIKIGDGTTAWSALGYMATDSELQTSLEGYIAISEKGAVDGVAELDSNKNILTRESVIFEGATTNSYQTTLITVDPTADRTITLPDSTGTVVVADVSGNVIISGNLTVNGTTTTIDTQNLIVEDKNITIGQVATPTDITADGGGITLKGTTDKTFNWVDATDSWTSSENINLASGKTYFKNGTDIKDVTETLTNKTISGTSNTILNVANTSLTNSSITINGTQVSLGGSINIAGDIEGVTAGTGLTGGGTSGTVTLNVDTAVVATTNNTLTMSGKTLTSPVVSGLALSDSSIVFEGSSADEFETTLTVVNPTADRTISLPNVTGTVVTTGDTATVTNTMLANSSVTVNGTAISLGSSGTVTVPVTSGVTGLGTGVATFLATPSSANLAAAVTDETGSGALVFATSPTLITPSLGVATGTSFNSITGLSSTTPLAGGSAAVGTGTTAARADHVHPVSALTISTGLSGTSYNGSSAVTIAIDSTVATTSGSQTLTNKTISGTSNTITNVSLTTGVTGTLPAANGGTGITSLGTGIATFLGTPSSANLASAVTDETGSGSLVFATSPTLTTPNIGVATGTSFNSITGLSSTTPLVNGTAAVGTATTAARADHVHGTDTTRAPLASPTFTGTVTVPTPINSTDAATKQYVDDLAQGLHIHASVAAATTSNLTATYSNGSSGVGATLTNSSTQSALVIDGVTLSTNDRVLVKNQSTQLQNGIYTVTNTGSVSTNWVLTRATDMDQSLEVDGGDFVFVTGGTAGDNTGWVQVETGVTIGTSNIVFTQFSGAGTYLAGNGLTLTGNTFSINTGTTVDLNTAQTLTNKTISGTSNTITNISLTTGVTGTLPVANGGTGITSFGTGIATFLGTPSSANLAAAVTDETGSGALVFATSPTLTTPNIGTPSAAILTNATGLPVSTGISGLGTGVATALAVNVGSAGAPVVNGGALGTPSSGTLTNATGLPVTSGISGLGTGVATFLATPSSANLAAAVTDETGSGALVFATSPTLTTPNIGVATGTSFNSITALSSTTPSANGTAAVGTSTTVARADHVHPISALTIGTGLSGTSYNGSSAVTIAIDSTVATLTGSQTLTNKTLTSPVISSITNTGTLTLPTSTDTLVGRATTDTLTNKTINGASNTLTVRIANDVSGLASGAATFLATPSSANLAALLTDETGTGANVFATSPSFTTAITINATGELRLADTDSSHYVGFKSPATVTTNRIWTLPSADGTSGQVLSTDGAGTLSWSTASGGTGFANETMVIMGAY
jgi:hypothetical protein